MQPNPEEAWGGSCGQRTSEPGLNPVLLKDLSEELL